MTAGFRKLFVFGLFTNIAPGCGPSADELAQMEAEERTRAIREERQSDPAQFLMGLFRPGDALYAWQSLMETDCNLEEFMIWTPYEAHILSQVPYIIRGYPPSSDALHTFFRVDAEWYPLRNSESNAPLSQEATHCSRQLRNLEERFIAASDPIPEEAKNRFLMDPIAFRTWFQWGSGRVQNPYVDIQVLPDDDSGWIWEADGVSCRNVETGQERTCSRYSLRCPNIPEGLSPIDIPCEGQSISTISEEPDSDG